jgi:cytochrome c biogenesis protein
MPEEVIPKSLLPEREGPDRERPDRERPERPDRKRPDRERPDRERPDRERPERPDRERPDRRGAVSVRRGAVSVRRAWRRLVSMRTALVLLFLLALAAVPGSLLPQRPLNPAKVQLYLATHGAWGRFLDRIGGFDVFGSVWFSAVYLLLFLSLIGCLIPRISVYAKAARAQPLPSPRHLSRMAEHARLTTALDPHTAAGRVRAALRPRWRVVVRDEVAAAGRPALAVSAEKGYSREAGNLLFHVSLMFALLFIALGQLYKYEGTIVLTEGDGFCNPGNYDSFTHGRWVDVGNIKRFCVDRLNQFTVTYRDDGSPAEFAADVTYTVGLSGAALHDVIRVNHPLRVQGDRVYLLNHGFAPTITVQRPGRAAIAYTNPFLPQDGFLLSEGAFKITGPDRVRNSDIGISGLFAPTPQVNAGILSSTAPQPHDPMLALRVYVGETGLGYGLPQSVYALDQRQIDNGKLKKVAARNLSVGDAIRLADGTAITYTGYKQWVSLQVSHDPTQYALLAAAVCMITGLLGSLAIRRRRLWVRITAAAAGDRSLVEVGGLARSDTGDFREEFLALVGILSTSVDADGNSDGSASESHAAASRRD